MKKLMILALAAVAGVAANAAAINWSAQQISSGNGVTWTGSKADTKANGYDAYFFITASTLAADADYIVSYDDVMKALKGGDLSVLEDAKKGTKTSSIGAITATPIGSYGAGQDDTVSGFMVVFDAKDAADASYFGISDVKSATVKSGASGTSSLGYTTFTASNGWTKMESVPEPTSGLLLLLGMAGLALRRRRA